MTFEEANEKLENIIISDKTSMEFTSGAKELFGVEFTSPCFYCYHKRDKSCILERKGIRVSNCKFFVTYKNYTRSKENDI